MMNVSVSITDVGKNISVFRRKVLIYLVLSDHAQMHKLDDLRYLKIKRSHHYYLTEGNGGVGKNLTS